MQTSHLVLSALSVICCSNLFAEDLKPLDPIKEPDRIAWWQLEEKLGPIPKESANWKIGVVEKTLVNEHWRQMQQGYMTPIEGLPNLKVDVQAAQTESDQLGQLNIAENMVTKGYNALCISPISNVNLQPAIDEANAKKLIWINVEDAVIPSAAYFVGSDYRENGMKAARWFIKKRPSGGQVAVIEGQPGSYAAINRTKGFKDAIDAEGKAFKVVASLPGNWDRQQSYDAATNILQRYPDLIGFYCNNDTMALGVVEAVKGAGKLKQIAVIGTDGVPDALLSVKNGELAGTVDAFPALTGEIAKEVAVRLLAGQKLPRVIASAQAMVDQENYSRYTGNPADVKKAIIEDERSAAKN
jgi:ribose transport system substrate-binding protein